LPHALTDRQREYLKFIREFIKENESSPRLEEVAEHFGVTSPTAHKTLKALMNAGFLYFGRSSTSGFFIRLIERAGSAEVVIEIPIVGKVDRYGELFKFPENHGHFATLLMGAAPDEVFSLWMTEDIPEANILAGDLLICDYGKKPQPGDMVVLPMGLKAKKFLLCQVWSLTMDKDMPNFEVSNPYPIPNDLIDSELGKKLNWYPIAYSEVTEDYLQKQAKNSKTPMEPIPPDLVLATVLRLTRNLAW
jgi:SOS-response transcriptional repressor LexA